MNILGLGTDLVAVRRVEALLDRYGERFLDRVFSAREQAECLSRARPAMHLAARLAAKEAAMKALGTGHSQGVLWRDIEVVRGGGPPRLTFRGGALRHFQRLGAASSLLTITHADTLALAQVIILKAD